MSGIRDNGCSAAASSKSLPNPPNISSRNASSTANTITGSIDHAVLQGDDPRLRSIHQTTDAVTGIPAYPRRRWSLADVHLPRRSSLWPKPVVAVQVHHIPAATVAIRITECLRRRSIAVETNEEDATAVCSTVDGCVWKIHIWHGLIVECMPLRGSTLSFHSAAMAVLRAAEGLDSGADERRPWQVSPLEFPRLIHIQQRRDGEEKKENPSLKIGARVDETVDTIAREGLERIRELLLHKDRLECRQLGLESLVGYTDSYSVSEEVAKCVAHLLTASKEYSTLNAQLLSYIAANTDDESSIATESPLLRTMALHVLANLRILLDDDEDFPLFDAVPNQADLLAGAVRPATMTSRPGPHDAALTMAAMAGGSSQTTEPSWDRCCTAGRATHQVLADQTRLVYEQTTRAEREC